LAIYGLWGTTQAFSAVTELHAVSTDLQLKFTMFTKIFYDDNVDDIDGSLIC